MIIARLIILLVVVALLLWLLKRLFGGDSNAIDPKSLRSENMQQCKYCGIHVPESSIVMHDNRPYCSREHANSDQS